jgi:hypothetical protein
MHNIQPKQNGFILVDGQPFATGSLSVVFEDPEIIVVAPHSTRNPVLRAYFSDILDPNTEADPFQTFDDLKTFALENFFREPPAAGASIGELVEIMNSYVQQTATPVTYIENFSSYTWDPIYAPNVVFTVDDGGKVWRYDNSDTETEADNETCLVNGNGLRYKRILT